MQSTGQGAMHNLQPVHSERMIVCMNWCAPVMQSTGHALLQCVQPMHFDSSMNATLAESLIEISPPARNYWPRVRQLGSGSGLAWQGLLYAYLTLIPGSAPESTESRKISFPPGPAANTMPSDVPNRILRGSKLATATTRRPSNSAGS